MNIILKLYTKLCVLFCKVKYIIYFNIFLNVLLINYLYYRLWNVPSNKLTTILNFSIKLNGCVVIKLIQWLNSNLEFVFNNSGKNEFICHLFAQYYENCPIHELKYTKALFFKEFGILFDDYFELDDNFLIKSGSIAQVYKARIKNDNANNAIANNSVANNSVAIKVVHPEIQYQLICPNSFVKLYTYLVSNFKCFNKYDIIIDLNTFFSNLEKQINMENEYNNNEYFYNNYNNNIIIIPKPLLKSKNFLVMEFVDGEQFENLDISDYKKQILISFIGIFMKDTFINGRYVHCDLHQANWKVYRQTSDTSNNDISYKIIIYDFGYVIENRLNAALKKMLYYFDTNNLYELGNLLFHNIKNIDISNSAKFISNREDFITRFKNHSNNAYPYSDSILITTTNFCYINGYKLNHNLLDYFISVILLNKHFKKYLFLNYDEYAFNEDMYCKYIYNTNIFYVSICEKYDVFHSVKDYLYDTYINNPTFSERIKYTNNYFNTLKYTGFDVSQNQNTIVIDIDI